MTDLEINAMAEGILKYLSINTSAPCEGLTVLGITTILLFSNAYNGSMTMEAFVEDFKNGILASWKDQSAEGSGRLQ